MMPKPDSASALMRARISHRTFDGRPLTPDQRSAISAFLAGEHRGPFGAEVRFVLVDRPAAGAEGTSSGRQGRLGTYGVIRGAETFIAAAVRSNGKDSALEDYGFLFERAVLQVHSLGLGTCWLGGTFSRSAFSEAAALEADEILPCITPVGRPLEKRTLLERAMRTAARSSKRKPWHELFFVRNFDNPIEQESAGGPLADALHMVQAAPSASNKQPWRIVYEPSEDSHRYHFYLHTLKGYVGNMSGFVIQRIDLGIAMLHFAAAAAESGFSLEWSRSAPDIFIPPSHNGTITYLASCRPVPPDRTAEHLPWYDRVLPAVVGDRNGS